MYRFVTALSVLLVALPALGQFDSGSDGTDLALDCAALFALNPDCGDLCNQPCTVQINLASAATGDWDTPIPPEFAGRGIYDPQQWAVVFKYTTIDIPAGITVTFANHRNGAPVMWLASGDVTIAGSVRLDGADGSQAEGSGYAIPGPGGFSGGIRLSGGSAGFGPGGGRLADSVGGGGGYGSAGDTTYGGVTYGTDTIVPLIGGSGGGHRPSGISSGGAGGGAIMIASSGDIFLDSTGGIFATGGEPSIAGAGSGSGGGIRLVANEVSGLGILRALGGVTINAGGVGRIRVDTASDLLVDRGNPPFSMGLPAPVFPAPEAPSLRVTAVNGKPVPLDPLATVISGDVAFFSDGLPVTIDIELLNLPEAAGLTVDVRIVQAEGTQNPVIVSTPLADDGNGGLAATAEFAFNPLGRWEVQLSFQLP